MTNSIPLGPAAVKVGWRLLAILTTLAVLLFVGLAYGWIPMPQSSGKPHSRATGTMSWPVIGAIVLFVLLDALAFVWIIRHRRGGVNPT